MATLHTPATVVAPAVRPSFLTALRAVIPDYWALTKPEVNFLIVIATFTGFYLGYPGELHALPVARLLNTLLGTLLVASGTGTLNQYIESRFDARMRRTSRRPIPAGRVRPSVAGWIGISLATIGTLYLFTTVNALASALAVFTLTSYLLVYTPLKRITPFCTLAGAFPGAMPPLIGWAAAAGSLSSARAWMLYAVLFLWQLPHFMAIAWMYREDYARAGYLVLPAHDHTSFLTWATAAPTMAMLIAATGCVGANGGGIVQYSATIVLGVCVLYYAGGQIVFRSRIAARKLLRATIVYLPLQFLVFLLGKN